MGITQQKRLLIRARRFLRLFSTKKKVRKNTKTLLTSSHISDSLSASISRLAPFSIFSFLETTWGKEKETTAANDAHDSNGGEIEAFLGFDREKEGGKRQSRPAAVRVRCFSGLHVTFFEFSISNFYFCLEIWGFYSRRGEGASSGDFNADDGASVGENADCSGVQLGFSIMEEVKKAGGMEGKEGLRAP
ncbi:unnamed protein product [Linum tenue]|uniref:Uncharacterized protein n=1 Tax=Linum tenue TaxID=586396 RepID=A0AAV0Q584_9ROSI|nr:unnamed protein product [Linum tenue]